jgi:hypothetical protein
LVGEERAPQQRSFSPSQPLSQRFIERCPVWEAKYVLGC